MICAGRYPAVAYTAPSSTQTTWSRRQLFTRKDRPPERAIMSKAATALASEIRSRLGGTMAQGVGASSNGDGMDGRRIGTRSSGGLSVYRRGSYAGRDQQLTEAMSEGWLKQKKWWPSSQRWVFVSQALS